MTRHGNKVFWVKTSLTSCYVLLGLVSFIYLIYDFCLNPSAIWFKGFDYFTIQCNLMVWAFGICFLLNIKYKIIRSSCWMNFVGAYVIGMFIIYNVVLLPGAIKNGVGDEYNKRVIDYWTESVIRHEIIPLLFLGSLLVCGKYKQWDKSNSLWKSVGRGMIYPCTYTTYALFIPLASKDGSTSVYGSFSNVWSNHGGSPISLIYVVMSLILFFGGLVLCWYVLNDWWILKKPTPPQSK